MGSKVSRQQRRATRVEQRLSAMRARHQALVRDLDEHTQARNTSVNSHQPPSLVRPTDSSILNQELSAMSEQELRINLALTPDPPRSSGGPDQTGFHPDGESSEASSASRMSGTEANPGDVTQLQELLGSQFEARLLDQASSLTLAPTPAPLTLLTRSSQATRNSPFLTPSVGTALPRSLSALPPCPAEAPAALPRANSQPSLTTSVATFETGDGGRAPVSPKYCLICADEPSTGNALVNCWQCTATWCLKHYNKLPNRECPQCRGSLLSLSTSSGDSTDNISRPSTHRTSTTSSAGSRIQAASSDASTRSLLELIAQNQRLQRATGRNAMGEVAREMGMNENEMLRLLGHHPLNNREVVFNNGRGVVRIRYG